MELPIRLLEEVTWQEWVMITQIMQMHFMELHHVTRIFQTCRKITRWKPIPERFTEYLNRVHDHSKNLQVNTRWKQMHGNSMELTRLRVEDQLNLLLHHHLSLQIKQLTLQQILMLLQQT